MRLHIDVLGLLHLVWGGLGLLTGVSLGVLAIGLNAALISSRSVSRVEIAAVWLLVIVGAILAGGGGALILTGRGLRRRAGKARLAALVLAVPNLILLPFGTALGIYALWTLLNNDARREFGRPLRDVPPATGA
jgi:hypothetical protein